MEGDVDDDSDAWILIFSCMRTQNVGYFKKKKTTKKIVHEFQNFL